MINCTKVLTTAALSSILALHAGCSIQSPPAPINSQSDTKTPNSEVVKQEAPKQGTANGQASSAAGNKPNVILIVADDLGFGDTTLYGSKTIQTPNIQSIADGHG